jgi:molybdenum-dependent DNA-binding transcriptional regulator ModE
MVLTPVAKELMVQYADLKKMAQTQVDKRQKDLDKLIKTARSKQKK